MGEAIRAWHPAQSWKPGPVMYDLFPMVWAFDRGLYTTRTMNIAIETGNGPTRGMTIPHADGTPVEVSTDARAADLRELYLATILA
ncbi:MAG: hypothetical protein QM820_12405 [Minicystis sp.]